MSVILSERERRAMAALTALPPDRTRTATVRTLGPVRVWETFAGTCPGLDPDQLLDAHTALGWRLICPGDHDWPTSLTPAGPAPLALWAHGHGHLATLATRALAVTGNRSATPESLTTAARLAHDLATTSPPVTVTATASRGIARAALTAAAPHAPTLAILVGDLLTDRAPQPELLAAVAATGLVLSEIPPLWAPATPPTTRDRGRRNTARARLLATLTQATLVLESTPGGAGIATARAARALGRPLLALPTYLHGGEAAHYLLLDRLASPVTTAADITTHLPRS
ncbi:DNA-processing protein DprA [Parafrankia discariae]|uniref:DNA-processing protein DprA n=1 Tax=Parafrankia discariae TaxID=365528 RepID=UPI00055021D3|nr:DNA-processing protein DprA [Parafrankia discariae]